MRQVAANGKKKKIKRSCKDAHPTNVWHVHNAPADQHKESHFRERGTDGEKLRVIWRSNREMEEMAVLENVMME